MRETSKVNVLFTFIVTFTFLVSYILRLFSLGINLRVIISQLMMLVPAVLYIFYLKPDSVKTISMDPLSFSSYFKIIIMTFLMMPFISLINNISTIFVENKIANTIGLMSDNPLYLNIILIGVLPAFSEEFIFRGLIFHGYKKVSPLRAMILSGFLFGLIHLNINQFLYAFVMGFLFSLIVYVTNSLWASITAHLVFNGFNVIVAYYASKLPAAEEVQVSNAMKIQGIMVLFVVSLIGIIISYFLFISLCKKNRGIKSIKLLFKKSEIINVREKLIDGFLIIGIAICIIFIVFSGI